MYSSKVPHCWAVGAIWGGRGGGGGGVDIMVGRGNSANYLDADAVSMVTIGGGRGRPR